jgi:hypothetical protein
MLFVRSLKLPLALLLSISALSAQAVTVQSQLQALGGNSYQYNYTITNDDLASGFDEISIFFSNTQYQNLAVTASPFDWDSIVLQPDAFLDGVFDSLALSAPLALGDSVSGFSVSFDWLGAELPGAQIFDVLDSSSLTVLQSGTSSVTAVPLPASLPLMSAALAGLAFIRQRKK